MDIKCEKEEITSPKTGWHQSNLAALPLGPESANENILRPKKLVVKVTKLPADMLRAYSTNEKFSLSFECDICAQTFVQKPSLLLHMRKHINPKPTKCTLCFKEFRCYATLLIHQTVHTGEKSFTCSICYKKYSRKDSLKSHMTVHVHNNDHNFECSDCHKKF